MHNILLQRTHTDAVTIGKGYYITTLHLLEPKLRRKYTRIKQDRFKTEQRQ